MQNPITTCAMLEPMCVKEGHYLGHERSWISLDKQESQLLVRVKQVTLLQVTTGLARVLQRRVLQARVQASPL